LPFRIFFVVVNEPLNITVMIIFFLPAPVAMGVHYVLKHAFRALW